MAWGAGGSMAEIRVDGPVGVAKQETESSRDREIYFFTVKTTGIESEV